MLETTEQIVNYLKEKYGPGWLSDPQGLAELENEIHDSGNSDEVRLELKNLVGAF